MAERCEHEIALGGGSFQGDWYVRCLCCKHVFDKKADANKYVMCELIKGLGQFPYCLDCEPEETSNACTDRPKSGFPSP